MTMLPRSEAAAGVDVPTFPPRTGQAWGVARELDPADVVNKPITIVGDEPRVDLLTQAWSVRYADAAPKAQKGGDRGGGDTLR